MSYQTKKYTVIVEVSSKSSNKQEQRELEENFIRDLKQTNRERGMARLRVLEVNPWEEEVTP